MKIIDCFMYYDEDLVLDIRLNVLDKYVSNFVICEANFNHNGTKRDLKFDIKNFSKFKEKIIYIPLKQQPKNLRIVENHDDRPLKNSKILDNAVLRENFQRNYLQSAWWLAFFPGLMIMLVTLSLNLLSSWLRILLDPRQNWRLNTSRENDN